MPCAPIDESHPDADDCAGFPCTTSKGETVVTDDGRTYDNAGFDILAPVQRELGAGWRVAEGTGREGGGGA